MVRQNGIFGLYFSLEMPFIPVASHYHKEKRQCGADHNTSNGAMGQSVYLVHRDCRICRSYEKKL